MQVAFVCNYCNEHLDVTIDKGMVRVDGFHDCYGESNTLVGAQYRDKITTNPEADLFAEA